MTLAHKRILIKLSGEVLLGTDRFGIDGNALLGLAHSIKKILDDGHELGLVVGGGNIFRGVKLNGMGVERTPADQMGMLATLMNGIAIQQACESIGIPARVMSALECPKVAETYNWHHAIRYISSGSPVIFVGGTGSPYFTTDTAAALRASEMKVDILLKATKVAGVFTEDPKKNPEAKKYPSLTYTQYLAEKLGVMDATSVALCRDNNIPIFVFSMEDFGKVSIGALLATPEKYGTMIN
jgi:uridylate kinase